MKVSIIGVTLLISYVQSANLRIDPLVLIEQGLVRGQRASDGDYTTFFGIPYATVDENDPFGPGKKPEPFEEEIYRANNGSIICPQTPYLNDTSRLEGGVKMLDCLRLNIYVPNEATSSNPMPVLVWIHGGRFTFGSAGEYGARKLVKQNILVVTINYRLGPYGFMCLDVPNVTGNQGLKDQFDALSWVRSNIRAFGGNPYNVTLAGQSAGSCSTLLQLYSPKDKLFHKVIAESGSPQSYGMFVNGDTQAAVKLANHLGLDTTDTTQALEYLARTPHELVTGATRALNLILRPCKERSFSGVENFVDSDPYTLSHARKVSNTPILIGHTSKEEINSLAFMPGYFDSDPIFDRIAENYNLNEDRLNTVASTIRHYYIGDSAISPDVTSRLEDFESDYVFTYPIERTIANLLKENAGPVYSYVFSYVGDTGAVGAAHSAELRYLFDMNGGPSSNDQWTDEDQRISDQITTLWGNFVKFGNPTPNSQNTLSVTWTPVTSVTRPALVIDRDLRIESRVFSERKAFWDLFHDNYVTLSKLSRECRA